MVRHSLIYLPLLFPVPAALAARPLAERLAPWLATWLLTTCALALAALSCVALGVLVVAGLVRLPLAALVGDWSPATVPSGDSVSKIEAAAAGALLVAAVLAGVRMLWRRMRALAAAAFEAACLPGPGRVVVSTGMLDALNHADRKAMLAHERAHLAYHHYAFVAAAHLAAACNPLLRPAAAARSPARWARPPWPPPTTPPADGSPKPSSDCSNAAVPHCTAPVPCHAASPPCSPSRTPAPRR